MTKYKVGDVLAITFLDHVEDGDEPIRFIVYGRAVKITRGSICVESWEYADANRAFDTNEKRYTIIKKAIERVDVLRSGEIL